MDELARFQTCELDVRWRTEVDLLVVIKLSVEICALDIDLVSVPTVSSSKGENDTNRG